MLQRKNPISLDKMYPSQPSSTSLSADKNRAIEPAVSDHEKCEKSESSLSSRFSKRLASIFFLCCHWQSKFLLKESLQASPIARCSDLAGVKCSSWIICKSLLDKATIIPEHQRVTGTPQFASLRLFLSKFQFRSTFSCKHTCTQLIGRLFLRCLDLSAHDFNSRSLGTWVPIALTRFWER